MQKKTVFVLGAGVSMQYGFPSGAELVDNICEELAKSEYEYKLHEGKWVKSHWRSDDDIELEMNCLIDALLVLCFDYQEIQRFRERIYYSDTNSIDSFLRNNKHFKDLGKTAISHILIKAEQEVDLFLRQKFQNKEHSSYVGPSVYKYIWSQMQGYLGGAKSVKYFMESQCPLFVTFNYDRSLEQYFSKVIMNYCNNKSGVDTLIASRIRHVHGCLGLHTADVVGPSGVWPYNDHIEVSRLQSACNGIRIIGDKNEDETFVDNLRSEMLQAERIIFLGFAYHPDNLRTLFGKGVTKAQIFGTTYGMTQQEVYGVKRMFEEYVTHVNSQICIEPDHNEMTAYEYLREVVSFGVSQQEAAV
ncbi:hypothetical protein KS4_23050 [Poriferisphaera corsica]|uniref:SIR2-like domain-containing protein n=1 Tax=Poriferisphaera corsica TaxID=2528020 RepID=A0A517YVK1_9BACT|nr:hypothetical protein [Poriferisphaera corsica]QDU34240.1 hypothetical protein KS4_23050 [Poriferisphaera corsica]